MTVPRLKLEARQKLLLGISAACVAMILLVRFLYVPIVAKIGEHRAGLTDLRVKSADARLLSERLPQEERALTQVREQYHALETRVGHGQSVARILETLSQQAKDHRLELALVQPREEDDEQRVTPLGPHLSLREVPLTLQLTGRYRQVGEFLGKLPDVPFIGSVQELKVTKPDATSAQLRADLVLAVYLAEGTMPQ